MISVKEYADSRGISRQAVYKQLKIHHEVLQEHIHKIDGKKCLDDYAIEYLTNRTDNNHVHIMEFQVKEELQRLREREIELLNELNIKNNIIIQLQQENKALLEDKNQSFFSRLFGKKK